MARLPPIKAKQYTVCIIRKGNEDYAYMQRLLRLRVWDPVYNFRLINVKGESSIFACYQDTYNNDRYEIILI